MKSRPYWMPLAFVLAALPTACGDDFTITNSAPSLTQIALTPLEDADADATALTLWLSDRQGDPVDVALSWTQGAEHGTITLLPGSAPLSGLPTELALAQPLGQAHTLTWDLADVPDGAVTLVVALTDRNPTKPKSASFTIPGIDPRTTVYPARPDAK